MLRKILTRVNFGARSRRIVAFSKRAATLCFTARVRGSASGTPSVRQESPNKLNRALTKVFSSKHERDIKRMRGRPLRRAGSHPAEAGWDVLKFLARFFDHPPEPSQQMVRYQGYYANAARGGRRKSA